MVLGWIFQKAGVPFVPAEATQAVNFVILAVGALMTFYGRWRAGGITWFGSRKYYPK